jgi:hypothetical protein
VIIGVTETGLGGTGIPLATRTSKLLKRNRSLENQSRSAGQESRRNEPGPLARNE